MRGENLRLLEKKASIHVDDRDVSYYGRQVEGRTGHFGVVQPTKNTREGKQVRISMPNLATSAVRGLLNDKLRDDVNALEIRLDNDGRNGCFVDIYAKTSPIAQRGAQYIKTHWSEKVAKKLAHWVRKGTINTLEEGHCSTSFSKNTQPSHFDDTRNNGKKRFRSDNWDGFRGKSTNNIPYSGGNNNNLL